VPTSITNLAGQNFNYMQWRTAAGGLEIGNVSITSSGDITHDSFHPAGVLINQPTILEAARFLLPALRKTFRASSSPSTKTQGDDVVFGTPEWTLGGRWRQRSHPWIAEDLH